jgi:hypothetical protein
MMAWYRCSSERVGDEERFGWSSRGSKFRLGSDLEPKKTEGEDLTFAMCKLFVEAR